MRHRKRGLWQLSRPGGFFSSLQEDSPMTTVDLSSFYLVFGTGKKSSKQPTPSDLWQLLTKYNVQLHVK
jgi:hypothetical protein